RPGNRPPGLGVREGAQRAGDPLLSDVAALLAFCTIRVEANILRSGLRACFGRALALVDDDRRDERGGDDLLALAVRARRRERKAVLVPERTCDASRSVAPRARRAGEELLRAAVTGDPVRASHEVLALVAPRGRAEHLPGEERELLRDVR